MGNQREAEIAGRKLIIFEHDDVVEPVTGKTLTGSWIWGSSFLLARWLDTPSWPLGSFEGKRVVELGAGTGLPGMASAVLGAEVVLTDRPGLIPGLQRNVEGNGLSQRVKVRALEWGDDCSELYPPVDFILMSDLLYDVEAMPQLCDTILQLSDDHTQILLAYEPRLWTSECLQVLWETGLLFEQVGHQELPTDCQNCEEEAILKIWRSTRVIELDKATGCL